MLEKAALGSEIVRRNIIPDDPYPSNPNDVGRSSVPGTPAQSAPDYVLNPLSIYRMARKAIPEKHAPEKTTSSVATSTRQVEYNDQLQHSPQTNHADMAADHIFDSNPADTNFDELQMFFDSNPAWAWHPSETAVGSGLEGTGFSPWVPTFRN